MRKILCTMLSLTVLLLGHGNQIAFAGEAPSEAKLTTKANLEFLTASATGNWFTMGALIAEQTNRYFTSNPITAVPAPGSIGNPPLVARGDSDIGLAYGSFLLMSQNGESPYETKTENLRAVASLSPTLVHVWGTKDVVGTDLTLEDLITKHVKMRFGAMPAGKGSYFVSRQMFQAMGIEDMDSISEWGASLYYAEGSDLVNAWKDRQVDVVMNLLNAPDSLVEEALTSREGRLIDFGKNLAAKMAQDFGFMEYIIPAGTYVGQDYDVKTVGLPLVIFTRDDVDDTIIYYMCKAIYEHIGELVKANNAFAEVDVKKMHLGGGVRLHPGAEKFYKEVGLID